MTADAIWQKGDVVMASYGWRTVEARVILASGNGKSLMIKWDDGMLGGHAGVMPILRHDSTGKYYSLIEGLPITLDEENMTTFHLGTHFATSARPVIEVWEGSEFIAAIYPGDEPRSLRIVSKNRITPGEPDIRPPANGLVVSIGDGL